MDALSFLLEGLVCGLQRPYYLKACDTVVEWFLVVQNAINEVSSFNSESFQLFDAWRPHVSGPVADKQVVSSLSVRHLHSLVVDLDFFVSLKVIPHQHLLFAADQSSTDFDRLKPVNI